MDGAGVNRIIWKQTGVTCFVREHLFLLDLKLSRILLCTYDLAISLTLVQNFSPLSINFFSLVPNGDQTENFTYVTVHELG